MEKLPVGKYIIKDTFNISGRGLVFTGLLTQGEIHIGNKIEFDFNGEILIRKITGITMNSRQRTNLTGLLIECNVQQGSEDLSQWEPENVSALIWK